MRCLKVIDTLSDLFGRLAGLLLLCLVLLVGYDVMMRYLFQAGSVALQELEWHLFALIFLLGAAYTLKEDAHVRVDVLYRSRFLTDRHRAWVDLLGGIFFLLPFCVLMIVSSLPFIESAYHFNEASPDPGGLPHRFLLKAVIPFGFLLVLLQGLAVSARSFKIIKRR